MAGAGLIASAIALILLIIAAYVVVGGILATTEIVSSAQNAQAGQIEERMRTGVLITDMQNVPISGILIVDILNSGSETISEFKYMDLYIVFNGSAVPEHYSYADSSGLGTWKINSITPDNIHTGNLDPDEEMNVSVYYPVGMVPLWLQVVTPNGVYDSAYV